jgi:hypothetical protein
MMTGRPTALLVLIALMAVASPAAAAGIEINVAAGVDFLGEFDLDAVKTDADPGFTLGLEVIFDVPVVELGVGLEYGFPRGGDIGELDVAYYQLYGLARLTIIGRLYLVARLGYYDVSVDNLEEGDLDGDGAISAGAGLGLLEKLKVELLFNNIAGDFAYESWVARLVYTF